MLIESLSWPSFRKGDPSERTDDDDEQRRCAPDGKEDKADEVAISGIRREPSEKTENNECAAHDLGHYHV
jgi:hypothetical protein